MMPLLPGSAPQVRQRVSREGAPPDCFGCPRELASCENWHVLVALKLRQETAWLSTWHLSPS